MARSVNLKPFYIGLGLIAVGGAAAIWLARARGSEAVSVPVGPVPVAAADFEGYPLGADSAPVEIIEYSSFECGWCARFALLTMPDVRRRLVDQGKVRWVFRDFPVSGSALANLAHHAAACAAEQDLFWPMHDRIFFNQGRWARDSRPERLFREYARLVGVELDAYESCMSEGRYAARIEATKRAGMALGVNSTPTFVINGTMRSGFRTYDDFRRLLEEIVPGSTQ